MNSRRKLPKMPIRWPQYGAGPAVSDLKRAQFMPAVTIRPTPRVERLDVRGRLLTHRAAVRGRHVAMGRGILASSCGSAPSRLAQSRADKASDLAHVGRRP